MTVALQIYSPFQTPVIPRSVVLPGLDFLLTVTIMVGRERESTRPQKGTRVFVLGCSLRNEHLIYLVSNNVNGETRFLIQRAEWEEQEQQCRDQGASLPPTD